MGGIFPYEAVDVLALAVADRRVLERERLVPSGIIREDRSLPAPMLLDETLQRLGVGRADEARAKRRLCARNHADFCEIPRSRSSFMVETRFRLVAIRKLAIAHV